MNIVQATTTCLKKYFTFSGRAKRSEFWWFYLFGILVTVVYTLFVEPLLFAWIYSGDFNLFIFYLIGNLPILLFMIPILAAGSRRLHDTGKSGWWQIVGVIPLLGLILLIVWWATNTKQEGDKYGEAMADNLRHRSILIV